MRLWISILTAALAWGQNADPGDWLTYGKNLQGWRYSELSQIDVKNVAQLVPQWIYQTGVAGKFETSPLVFDRQMFFTGPSNHAFALDLLTGRPVWHYAKPVPKGLSLCCGQPNRGFARQGDRLYKVNLESTLVALDVKTGAVIWETPIGDTKKGYTTTVAPLVAKNLVIVGVAGAEFGVRGFIDAFHAETGKHVWRFYTVAGPEDPAGMKTWGGDSWKQGGASIWVTGTYDPELNLTYWGTGNPGPDMYGDDRPGDNLYSCAVVALDLDTGKLKWHYQFTPHDVHDWDAIADPVLVDLNIKGAKVKGLIQANRNGFFYALDRTNGKLLAAKAYTKVTWADGIGPNGRPILIAGQDPTEDGNKSCPGLGGGHNWQATTYSPQTGMYYFPTTEGCQIYYKTKQEFMVGAWYQGSTVSPLPTEPATGAVVAVDPATGDTKWRYLTVSPPSSGLLSTAGGLVFSGDREGYFTALDAHNGKVLWKFQTGGPIGAPPISYSLDGRQYIAVAAGSSMFSFALPQR
ncbi:MAG: PQQ-dependent dehydrogenase, methanol/ethanol family [Bryobacteraceae bacterium]